MNEKPLIDCTDEELMLLFQNADDVRAFEMLVGRYKNPLMNFVFRFLGDQASSSDVVQETFIKVYRNKMSYKTIARFSTWVYTIAGNLAKSELARKKRKNLVSISAHDDSERGFDIPDTGATPDRVTDSGIKEEFIQQALMKLNEVYREAVILRDIQDLSYEEIAEMLNTTVGTVKSRINRGRAQLQILLKDIYNE